LDQPFLWISALSQKQNPNIIFILADDLGYGDIASFNKEGKIKTPNIDRIANAGVRFTDAHSVLLPGDKLKSDCRYVTSETY
jgi:hypothetical protein